MPIVIIFIVAGALITAAFPMSLGYYNVLRAVAMVAFFWAGNIAYDRKERNLAWIFYFLAILFNPIVKINLPKEIWVVIDIVSAVILIAFRGKIEEVETPPDLPPIVVPLSDESSNDKAQAEVIVSPKSTEKALPKSHSVDIDSEYEYKLINQTTLSNAESSFNKLDNWLLFISYLNKNDELWNYSAIHIVKTDMADVCYTAKGIALVRNGEMVKTLITNSDRYVDW